MREKMTDKQGNPEPHEILSAEYDDDVKKSIADTDANDIRSNRMNISHEDANKEGLYTYSQWSDMGFHVRRGQKAKAFTTDGLPENQPLFDESQVSKNIRPMKQRKRLGVLYSVDHDEGYQECAGDIFEIPNQ